MDGTHQPVSKHPGSIAQKKAVRQRQSVVTETIRRALLISRNPGLYKLAVVPAYRASPSSWLSSAGSLNFACI